MKFGMDGFYGFRFFQIDKQCKLPKPVLLNIVNIDDSSQNPRSKK